MLSLEIYLTRGRGRGNLFRLGITLRQQYNDNGRPRHAMNRFPPHRIITRQIWSIWTVEGRDFVCGPAVWHLNTALAATAISVPWGVLLYVLRSRDNESSVYYKLRVTSSRALAVGSISNGVLHRCRHGIFQYLRELHAVLLALDSKEWTRDQPLRAGILWHEVWVNSWEQHSVTISRLTVRCHCCHTWSRRDLLLLLMVASSFYPSTKFTPDYRQKA